MLETVTVNEAPEMLGVTLAGRATQLGGAPAPQLRLTGLAYPLIDVSVPLKTVDEFTCPVSKELGMAKL